MMGVIPDRIVAPSATAASEVHAVAVPNNKCEAWGLLGVVAGEGKSLFRRSGRRTLGVDQMR